MSDQDNLFNKEGDKSLSPDAVKDLLSSIKNEHGEQKYKTEVDALNALKASQEFIATLQSEKREQESKLEALAAKAEKIDALEQSLLELQNKNKEQDDNRANTHVPEGLTKQAVEELLNSREVASKQKMNLEFVVSAVKTAHGDEAEKVFYSKAEELGMSKEEMNSLAAKNPKLVLKILDISGDGANKQPNKFSPSNSSINTAGLRDKEPPIFKRPEKSIMIGASTADVLNEATESLKMVEALHEKGMSPHDLSNPSLYFKVFG